MNELIECLRHLVTANRILAREGVVDAFGHISVRTPGAPDRFIMARSRSPELVTLDDLLEFGFDGEPIEADGPTPYAERYIHAAIYEARPEIHSVVHNHAYDVIPFGVTGVPLRPIFHTAARMGPEVPVWDIAEKFGDTSLLVVNLEQGRDLARSLAGNRVVLMRGHGCAVAGESIQSAVSSSIYTQVNARLQMLAMQMGEVRYLAPGEIAAHQTATSGATSGRDRQWEYLRRRAGCDDI